MEEGSPVGVLYNLVVDQRSSRYCNYSRQISDTFVMAENGAAIEGEIELMAARSGFVFNSGFACVSESAIEGEFPPYEATDKYGRLLVINCLETFKVDRVL